MSATKAFKPRFLVVSIGNPLKQYPSLHSAGHYAARGLQQALRNPDFVQDGKYKNAIYSRGQKYELFQSPTLMNVSGPFVKSIWRTKFLQEHEASNSCLVILHDELEMEMGKVKLVSWDRSPRGHNGIKSTKAQVKEEQYPESPLVRIAVGIGRPAERDAKTVSDYVLRPCSREQESLLEGEVVAGRVIGKLEELEREWKQEWERGQQS